MGRMGKIYLGRPLAIKSRRELLETVRPNQRRFLRADTGDLPPIEPESQLAAVAGGL
jgi:hypothetical protein